MDHELPNEPDLAARAATDAEAYSALYDFYFPRIWSYVIRRVGHKETAEDLVSQVFLKATEALPRRNGDAPFGAWLFRIAANCLIDHYRRKSRRPEHELELAESVPSAEAPLDSQAEARIAFAKIEAALAKLPERDQRLVSLKFFAGLSHKEIALAEKISESNVGVIIYRAMEKLRKESQSYG